MTKRLMVSLLTAGLLAAMLPGLASADQPQQEPLNTGQCIATPGEPGVEDVEKVSGAAGVGPYIIVFAPTGKRVFEPGQFDSHSAACIVRAYYVRQN